MKMPRREFDKFMKRTLNGQSMAEFYQVPGIRISMDQVCSTSVRVTLQSERPFIPISPPEIGRHIASFLGRETLVGRIVYSPDYPFRPPRWFSECLDPRAIVARHNAAYVCGWCPSFTIDKDILQVLMKYLE